MPARACACVDCDHPIRAPAPSEDLRPYMTAQVVGGISRTYGMRRRHGYVRGPPLPQIAAGRRHAP